jgi:hypothetical protein
MSKTLAAVAIAGTIALAGCNDADIASRNLSKAADMFEINRRIIFINGITDKYLLQIEGLCSLGNTDGDKRMSVTCKTGATEYKKHYLGTSDNVTFIAEQIEASKVSPYHYRIVFKPQSIIPEIDVRTSQKELLQDKH